MDKPTADASNINESKADALDEKISQKKLVNLLNSHEEQMNLEPKKL